MKEKHDLNTPAPILIETNAPPPRVGLLDRRADMDLSSYQNELSLITSFLGVPGYILSTFLPGIQQLARQQPKLFKILCGVIALSTFGLSLLDRIKRTLLSFLVSNFMFSTTIDSMDPLYTYMIRWLKERRKFLPEQELQARSKGEVARNSVYGSPNNMSPVPMHGEDEESPEVVYDFNGLQIYWHKWRPYFVTPYPQGRLGGPQFLTVRSFAFSSNALRDMIEEAYRIHRSSDQAHLTAVYRPTPRSGGWKCVARRNRRSLDTIVLDPAEKDRLLEDIKFYLSGEAKGWYGQRGIPYRRGYLFHGRPGTGKTSLSMAIAGHFALDIYIISLLDPHINDTFLHTFFTNLPKGALILLEDIDSAGLARETFDKSLQSYDTRRRGRRSTQPSTRVTLSGLLNAIDGADSPEGHLLIMTTNAPDALDEALVRPGRIDYKIGFKATSQMQAESMFLRMYKGDVEEEDKLDDLAMTFSKRIPDDTFTPAELQGHLLRYKKEPEQALEHLGEWMDVILKERKEIEDARLKVEKKAEKKKEKRKARKKARKNNRDPLLNGFDDHDSDSDSDSSDSDRTPEILPPPPPIDYDDDGESFYGELNADPAFADHSVGLPNGLDPGSPPRIHHDMLRPNRRNKSRDANWDDINGRERTCVIM